MPCYHESNNGRAIPRLPLEGELDLTYRCNNNCRHCWLQLSSNAPEKNDELSFDEIRDIVDQARALGTRKWGISGGEPMLRPDFAEIFDYITRKASSYKLNTNGSLITPKIAVLMRRKGSKMVALYGATADVHDHITRRPGSFEATMRGFAYLKEAGAKFTVQLVPMRESYHQWPEMQALGHRLSPDCRLGASWLYLSANHDPERNASIQGQRVLPEEILELDHPPPPDDLLGSNPRNGEVASHPTIQRETPKVDDFLLDACIYKRNTFHVDPYGQMTFCCFIKDPELQYDLRRGSLQDGWENFIPSLAGQIRGGREYLENCGNCELKKDCLWCPVFGYLEHSRYSARIDYLCEIAKQKNEFKRSWRVTHQRFYQSAGITIQVTSNLPIEENTFHPKFEHFRTDGPGKDTIRIRHYFHIPKIDRDQLSDPVHNQPPWEICRDRKGNWIYIGASNQQTGKQPHMVAVFSSNYSEGKIYHKGAERFQAGNLSSLSGFPNDQLVLARVLAERQACCLHSSAAVINGRGLLFLGHSGAGKSTIAKMLRNYEEKQTEKGSVEILCDEQNIIRREPESFRLYGTWSHSLEPVVSPHSAPLNAILFLEQAPCNELIHLSEVRQVLERWLPRIFRPLETSDWWDQTLELSEDLVRQVPFYRLRFDLSGDAVNLLLKQFE